jgi:uncharacterized GH25 family protein
MKKVAGILATALLLSVSTARAHSLWINAFASHAHPPGHTMVSLGWGHWLPMDDILSSPNGRVIVERFELFDPSGSQTQLIRPEPKLSEPQLSTDNFDLFAGDLGVQKIALKKKSAQGTYQLSAVSKASFYTQYTDKKGRERMKLKPKDELDDIEKIHMSVKYQAFAKSCMTVGAWSAPAPLGHGLEIIPRTDLSDLHAGDLVEVDVLFYGKPLTATAKSIEYITAHGSGFGQSDGFYLMSYIMEGKARFRVQSSGQWIIGVNHKDDVTADGPLKDLFGKAEQVYHAASLTFNVK